MCGRIADGWRGGYGGQTAACNEIKYLSAVVVCAESRNNDDMKNIATLSGTGILRSGDREGTAKYTLHIYADGMWKTGEGTLEADPGLLFHAIGESVSELELEDGRRPRILVTQASFPGNGEYKLAGALED